MQGSKNGPAVTIPGWFITATDTGAGKTWATLALMKALRSRGLNVAGMKPVATGCEETVNGLRNNDALCIQAGATHRHEYALINPYAFKPPVAPHIAAAQTGDDIDLSRIASVYQTLAATADCLLVEGIGGWRVPLGRGQTLADMVRKLELNVILVVGLRLGCINHALLTAESILGDDIRLAGWVANEIDPEYAEGPRTIATLSASIPAPLLADMPFLPAFDAARFAACFNVAQLLH